MLLLALACAPADSLFFQDGGPANERRPIHLDEDHDIALHAHLGTATIFGVNTLQRTEVAVGADPRGVAESLDRFVISLRGERSIAIVQDYALVDVIEVGAEPSDVAATDERIWVALATEHAITELDAETFEELRRFELPSPEKIALHPGAKALFVTSPLTGSVYRVRLSTGETTVVEYPEFQVFDPSAQPVDAIPRPSGDPDVDWDRLVVPTLVVDVETPEGAGSTPAGAYAAAASLPSDAPGRFTAVLVSYTLDSSGLPRDPESILVGRGAPGDVLLVGDRAYVPLPATDRVIEVDLEGTAEAELGYRRPVISTHTELEHPIKVFPNGAMQESRTRTLRLDDRQVALAGDDLGDELEEGRRLFETAMDLDVAASNSGVSCSNCHADGGTDGMVWPLIEGPRQTPSLAGVVSLTAPVTWTSDVESVSAEAAHTSTERMGGGGLTDAQLDAMEAWVDHLRPVDLPEQDPDEVARGEAIFIDQGCDWCHEPPLYGGGGSWDMFGETNVDTPSLLGVAATPPYLHDGRAETLHDVIELSTEGGMGDTSELGPRQVDALVAFLAFLEESE